MYNNDTGLWEQDEALDEGHWFMDGPGGYLYIIPQQGVIAESFGPDNQTLDALNCLIEEKGNDYTEEDLERIGVLEVGQILHRFDPQDGYYTA